MERGRGLAGFSTDGAAVPLREDGGWLLARVHVRNVPFQVFELHVCVTNRTVAQRHRQSEALWTLNLCPPISGLDATRFMARSASKETRGPCGPVHRNTYGTLKMKRSVSDSRRRSWK